MKLATLKNGTRDGQLVVVSRDLTRYTDASFLVPTLQAALDNWARVAPHLAAMAESLEHGSVPSLRFHEHDADSPLPRAYQLVFGGGAQSVQQGASDSFLAPRDPIEPARKSQELAVQAEVAVIIDDVERGATLEDARDAIRLVMLLSDVSLPGDPLTKTAAAFSPVAVTPDELGDAWDGSKIGAALGLDLNGKPVGEIGSTFDLARFIANIAKSRPLGAGTIIASSRVVDAHPLRAGDIVRIEMKDSHGHSIFGAIEQSLESAEA